MVSQLLETPTTEATPSFPATEPEAPYTPPGAETPAPPPESEPPAPEAQAAPPPEYVSKAEHDALLVKLSEIESRVTAKDRADQAELSRIKAETDAKARAELLTHFTDTYAMPANEAQVMVTAVETMAHLRSEPFQAQLKAYDQQFQTYQRQAHTWEQIVAAFPPNTTLATLRQHFDTVSKLETPAEREWMAKQLAGTQRAQNQQARAQSGAERTEGGGGVAGGGMSAQAIVDAYGSGQIPWNEQVQRAGKALGIWV